jgi:hypothetical protein
MEKTIPPFSFTVNRDEEKEEIKLQYQVIWHGETLTLMTRFTGKNLLKTMDPHSLQPPARCRRRREGDQRWWTTGAAAAAAAAALGLFSDPTGTPARARLCS